MFNPTDRHVSVKSDDDGVKDHGDIGPGRVDELLSANDEDSIADQEEDFILEVDDIKENQDTSVVDEDSEIHDQEESESGSEKGLKRSTRTRVTPVNLSPKWKGTSYMMKHQTGKVNTTPSKIIEQRYNLYTSEDKDRGDLEYSPIEAVVLVNYMYYMNMNTELGLAKSFGQQYQLSKCIKLFGDAGRDAAQSEIQQLNNRKYFKSISVNELTSVERRRAQHAMMLLTEKRDGTKKRWAVFDGRATKEWLTKEDSASPTATLEGIMLTITIDAHEGRDLMTADVPNAFIQTSKMGCYIVGLVHKAYIVTSEHGQLPY